jgi:hypothetical protein
MPGGSSRQLDVAHVVGVQANRNSRRRPITHLRSDQRSRITSAYGTSVWTGRALQVGYDGLEIVGLAHLYSAL